MEVILWKRGMSSVHRKEDGLVQKPEYFAQEIVKLTIPAMRTLIGLELKNDNWIIIIRPGQLFNK